MADTMQQVRESLDELAEAIEGHEEEHGSSEFTEGVMATIKFLTQAEPADVAGFVKEYFSGE